MLPPARCIAAQTLKDLFGKIMLQVIELARILVDRMSPSDPESAKVKVFHLNDKFFEFDGWPSPATKSSRESVILEKRSVLNQISRMDNPLWARANQDLLRFGVLA